MACGPLKAEDKGTGAGDRLDGLLPVIDDPWAYAHGNGLDAPLGLKSARQFLGPKAISKRRIWGWPADR